MTSNFFDAHTHVQFAAFEKDYKEIIERALNQGVNLVNVGTQKDTSRKAIELAHEFEGVWAVVGLHPIHTNKSYHDPQELGGDKEFTSRGEEFDHEFYKKLALDPKVVAIGECGLDYFRIKNNELGIKDKQKEVFIKQIELAKEVGKPLMIHCREAFQDLIEVLRTQVSLLNTPPGIIHFFSGKKDEAKILLEMGFYFTFGGVITFTHDYDEIVKIVPLDRILSETDAPYVTPVPYRGKRNEPSYVIEVVKKLAEIKEVSLGEITDQVFQNTVKIFSLN